MNKPISKPRELRAAYPYQFGQRHDYSFHRGWFHLVADACQRIDEIVREDRFKYRFQWQQIKEKWGTLRMYWHSRGLDAQTHVDIVSSGGIFHLVDAPTGESADALVAARIRSIVDEAMAKSASICAVCGAPGTLRHDGGWLLTLCDQHARQRARGRYLDLRFADELFGFEWDPAAVPAVLLRGRKRALARYLAQLETFAVRLTQLEGFVVSLPEVQAVARGEPVAALDPSLRDRVALTLKACRDLEQLVTTGRFDAGVSPTHALDRFGCPLASEDARFALSAPSRAIYAVENRLERALLVFAYLTVADLLAPAHAVRGAVLMAQGVLLSAGADPLMPPAGMTCSDLEQPIASARASGDATQLMRLLASWHPDARPAQ